MATRWFGDMLQNYFERLYDLALKCPIWTQFKKVVWSSKVLGLKTWQFGNSFLGDFGEKLLGCPSHDKLESVI